MILLLTSAEAGDHLSKEPGRRAALVTSVAALDCIHISGPLFPTLPITFVASRMMHVYFVLLALLFTVRCRAVVNKMATAPNVEVDEDDRTTTGGLLYEGAYRPQIHFSPPKVSVTYTH